MLQLHTTPPRFKLAPMLAGALRTHTATQGDTIELLWDYVRAHGLHDADTPEVIKCDKLLKALFSDRDVVPFADIPGELAKHLLPQEPVRLEYEYDPRREVPDGGMRIYDIEVEMEDPSKAAGSAAVNVGSGSSRELDTLDQRIKTLTASISESRDRLAFVREFAAEPAGFVHAWVESQVPPPPRPGARVPATSPCSPAAAPRRRATGSWPRRATAWTSRCSSGVRGTLWATPRRSRPCTGTAPRSWRPSARI